ncbi:STAS domain-containing protein [Streptomyces sp. NPDC005899]|uniref:STAS domain-containing protein n=1 Tax=Streptomyces sp. NPDC005899 TaxID=3155716 RepID=UPI0033C7C3DA
MFPVDVTRTPHGVVLTLRGELDFNSMVQVQEAALLELAEGTGPVVVDCAHLSSCDSSGISALIGLSQQLAARDRDFHVAALPPPVARLFALTGLDEVFSVHPEATAALTPRADSRTSQTPGVDDSERMPAEGRIA